jgi:hypothetical protein
MLVIFIEILGDFDNRVPFRCFVISVNLLFKQYCY